MTVVKAYCVYFTFTCENSHLFILLSSKVLHNILQYELINSELSWFVWLFFFSQIFQRLDEAVTVNIFIDVLFLQNDWSKCSWFVIILPTLQLQKQSALVVKGDGLKQYSTRGTCFSSCHERETKEKFWVPMRNWTSDLRIPHSDALPLNHKYSTVSEVYYEVHMIRVLHTAKISSVDSIMFVNGIRTKKSTEEKNEKNMVE